MKKLHLKNEKEVIIREAQKKDARSMIDFYNFVGGETDFLSFGKNEFKMTLHEYENFIESTSLEKNSTLILATIDEKIVSIASITSEQKNRTKHVGTLGIVVQKQYCGLGLGKTIMNQLVNWASLNGITKKISLVTREDNIKAIELYKKVGFQEEGILKQDTYINGAYYDTLVMGLIL